MKIRQGFVSNSSSSSFVMVVAKKAYDEVVAGLDPLDQAILEFVMEQGNVLGQKCMIYGDCSSDYWWDNININDIVNRAKEIAGDKPVMSDANSDDIDDDDLREAVRDGMGEYSVKAYFKGVPATQKWSYDMDW